MQSHLLRALSFDFRAPEYFFAGSVNMPFGCRCTTHLSLKIVSSVVPLWAQSTRPRKLSTHVPASDDIMTLVAVLCGDCDAAAVPQCSNMLQHIFECDNIVQALLLDLHILGFKFNHKDC
jgi:hypothetical protein